MKRLLPALMGFAYSLVEFEPNMSYINSNADLKTACGRLINAAKELGPSRQKLRAVF